MPRSNSGRIVLEIDPETKDRLYVALAKKSLTMKKWFLAQSREFIDSVEQPRLFGNPCGKPNGKRF